MSQWKQGKSIKRMKPVSLFAVFTISFGVNSKGVYKRFIIGKELLF